MLGPWRIGQKSRYNAVVSLSSVGAAVQTEFQM